MDFPTFPSSSFQDFTVFLVSLGKKWLAQAAPAEAGQTKKLMYGSEVGVAINKIGMTQHDEVKPKWLIQITDLKHNRFESMFVYEPVLTIH